MNDTELIQQTLQGDPIAFGRLMERYYDKVLLYTASLLRDYFEAEEVTQDAFLRGYHRLRELKDPNSFLPWIIRIAHNMALKRLRRRRDLQVIPIEELEEEIADDRSFEDELLRREAEEIFYDAMEGLCEEDRGMLWGRLSGESYRELSKRYGKSVGAVKMRVRRAKEKVREKVLRRLSGMMMIFPWGKIGRMIGGVVMKVTTKVAITGAVVMMLTGAGIWLSYHGEEKPVPKANEVKVERRANVEAPARVVGRPEKKEKDDFTFEEFNRLLDEYFESAEESSAMVSSEPVHDNEGEKSEIKSGEGQDEDQETAEEMSPELRLKVERYAELAKILPYVRQLEDRKTRLLEEYHDYLKTHDWDGYDEYGRRVQDVTEQYDDEIMAVIEQLRVYWAQIDAMFPELELWERRELPGRRLRESFRYDRLIEYFGRKLPWDGNPDYFKAIPTSIRRRGKIP